MPMYEYECEGCGKVTEALRPMRDADEPIACEHCGKKRTQRIHSVFAAASGGRETSLPMNSCGKCGDPRGSCGMN